MMSIMHAMSIRSSAFFCFQINCSDSKQGRGFGENTNSNSNSNRIKVALSVSCYSCSARNWFSFRFIILFQTNKSDKGSTTKQSRPLSSRKWNCKPIFICLIDSIWFDMIWAEAPRLSSQLDGKSRNDFLDVDFEERLKAVRRYTLLTLN